MTNLKHIEWHGGSSAHAQDRHRPRPSQRDLVAASLLRSGSGSGSAGAQRRWDERTHVEYWLRRD